MAKQRYINTRFWQDNYISNLDPSEKLLFLYCLTSPSTNISGAYEIPLKIIAADTGFDKDMILKIFARFEKDNKIIYKDGWLFIVNFIKHQSSKSVSVQIGINENLKDAPQWIKDRVWGGCGEGVIYSNLNSNLNSNSNLNDEPDNSTDEKSEKPIKEKFIPPTEKEIIDHCLKENLNVDAFKFIKHYEAADWKIKGGTKMKNWKQALVRWHVPTHEEQLRQQKRQADIDVNLKYKK